MSNDGKSLFKDLDDVGDNGWIKKVKEKPYLVSVGLLGAFLLGVGVLSAMMIAGKSGGGSEVEIIEVGEEEASSKEIVVDVGGAVIKPGLYKLNEGSRINDALVMAGGLSEEADRDWFSKNLNLAQKLVDGQKLYIPEASELAKGGQSDGQGQTLSGLININTASVSQLDTLWGVGEATANKIIEGRPYGAVEELLTKKVVNSNVYERLKDKVSVY
ncbi:MAG: helix-hairpin-helix domain-containing protein [Patescibacteria group bacterium]|nr:helix-hairpin-helix domain-containing protein [Patescibacteria group bacterium]